MLMHWNTRYRAGVVTRRHFRHRDRHCECALLSPKTLHFQRFPILPKRPPYVTQVNRGLDRGLDRGHAQS
jgi:hypothetical protein